MAVTTWSVGQRAYTIDIKKIDQSAFEGTLTCDGVLRNFSVKTINYDQHKKMLTCTIDGQFFSAFIAAGAGQYNVYLEQVLQSFLVSAVRAGEKQVAEHKKSFTPHLTSPLAGRVIKILVGHGHVVQARQPLVIIESMKMENEICAPHAAIVSSLSVAEGHVVSSNQQLMTFDAI
ncbi:hypothetical protein K2X40_05600 [Candidatus Babeliales bacterium]|nr:hypothetical protein [Candidatus Babeliales bacterium]